MRSAATPSASTSATAASAASGESNTASRRPRALPRHSATPRDLTRDLGDLGPDFADQPLERLGVVWRRLLADHGVEPQLDVWRQLLGELVGGAIPERVVVDDVGHRRPVVLDRGLPDP